MRIRGVLQRIIIAVLVLAGALPWAASPAVAQEPPLVFRLVKADTRIDHPDEQGADWLRFNLSVPQADGSVIVTAQPPTDFRGSTWQVWPSQGRATFKVGLRPEGPPPATVDVTWTVPPSIWSSDQDFTFTLTSVITNGDIWWTGGKLWEYPVERFQPGAEKTIVGENPFDFLQVATQKGGASVDKLRASGSITLRPKGGKPGPERAFRLGISLYIGGKDAPQTFVDYHYESIMPGEAPTPVVQLTPLPTGNPWDIPQGQQCFERWIVEAMSRLNAYNGDANFNARKPWSINKYGVLEGNPQYGPRSVAAPDNFPQYNYNKYWWMWDHWVTDANGYWRDPEWNAAGIPALRPFVLKCVADAGGAQPPGGQPPGGGEPPSDQGQQQGFPPIPSSWGCMQSGIVVNAIDGDPENQLNWCDNRVPFGDERSDKGRCFTFRYQVPSGGVTSAFLRMAIKPQGDADTDNIIAAVGQPQKECGENARMPGCVYLRGGLAGAPDFLDIDLIGNGCDSKIQVAKEARQPLTAQLQTGVLHVRLQDDTILYNAQLVLNCAPSCPGSGQPPTTGSGPGTTLPLPPFGGTEPSPNASRTTLQAAQRRVVANDLVLVPVWLINGDRVANINFELTYTASVARPEGTIQKGNLLDNALFSVNPNIGGVIRAGFAQTSGISGTGTVMYVPFRAVGKVGDRTRLDLTVTTINNPDGTVVAIDRIPGEIVIVGAEDARLGDCDGDGRLSALDAECALDISVGLRSVIAVLDMDKSGNITSRDAVMILQRVISIIR